MDEYLDWIAAAFLIAPVGTEEEGALQLALVRACDRLRYNFNDAIAKARASHSL